MKRFLVFTLCLFACSSSSDPAPADDDGGDDGSFEGGSACGLSGQSCGDTISTPCCSGLCAIGPIGQFTCQ